MKPAAVHYSLLGALVAVVLFQLSTRWIGLYYLDVLITIGINIILAVSLNLINGYTGQFSLGHAGFMAVGAYASASVTIHLGPALLPVFGGAESQIARAVSFLIALLGGGILAAVAGILVGSPSLRLKGDYLAIVTLGFGEIIRVIFQNIKSVGGALGLTGIPALTNIFWVYLFVVLTIFLVLTIVHSTYGRGFIAVHDDELAAEAMGINTTKYKIIAFVLGAFFAGIAGGLYGHFKTAIDPTGFGFMRSIEIVVMVILGGMGNTIGVIAAAIVLTCLTEFLRPIGQYRMLIYSFLLIVLMLTRPQGLFRMRWGPRVKPASNPSP